MATIRASPVRCAIELSVSISMYKQPRARCTGCRAGSTSQSPCGAADSRSVQLTWLSFLDRNFAAATSDEFSSMHRIKRKRLADGSMSVISRGTQSALRAGAHCAGRGTQLRRPGMASHGLDCRLYLPFAALRFCLKSLGLRRADRILFDTETALDRAARFSYSPARTWRQRSRSQVQTELTGHRTAGRLATQPASVRQRIAS